MKESRTSPVMERHRLLIATEHVHVGRSLLGLLGLYLPAVGIEHKLRAVHL